MGARTDKAKGRARHAAGDLLGEPRLERAGKKDRAKGAAKEKVDRAAGKAHEGIDKVAHSRKRTVNLDNA